MGTPKKRETGKVEAGLLQIVPPAQSLKSVQTAPAKQEIKSELRLPLEQPSLNLNTKSGEQLKAGSKSKTAPILEDPPAIAVPPATLDMPGKAEQPLMSDQLMIPLQPHEESPMMTKKLVASVVLGAAIIAAPVSKTARADERQT